MVVLWVGIAVLVLAVVVLGGIAYTLLGAVHRLRKEVAELGTELRPVLAQVSETAARAAQATEGRGEPSSTTGLVTPAA